VRTDQEGKRGNIAGDRCSAGSRVRLHRRREAWSGRSSEACSHESSNAKRSCGCVRPGERYGASRVHGPRPRETLPSERSDAVDLAAVELGLIDFANNISCLYPACIRRMCAERPTGPPNRAQAAAEFQKIPDHSGIVWSCWTRDLPHLEVACTSAGRLQKFPNALERRRPRDPHPEASQSRIHEVTIGRTNPALSGAFALTFVKGCEIELRQFPANKAKSHDRQRQTSTRHLPAICSLLRGIAPSGMRRAGPVDELHIADGPECGIDGCARGTGH
jgi:hypothetical protein